MVTPSNLNDYNSPPLGTVSSDFSSPRNPVYSVCFRYDTDCLPGSPNGDGEDFNSRSGATITECEDPVRLLDSLITTSVLAGLPISVSITGPLELPDS